MKEMKTGCHQPAKAMFRMGENAMIAFQGRQFLHYSLFGISLSLMILTDFPDTVLASCTAPADPRLQGWWKNSTPDVTGIQQVQVEYLCEEAIACSEETEDCTPLRAGYYVNILQSSVTHFYEWGQQEAQYIRDQNILKVIYTDGPSTTQFHLSLSRDELHQEQLVLHWSQSVTGDRRINFISGTEYFTKVSPN